MAEARRIWWRWPLRILRAGAIGLLVSALLLGIFGMFFSDRLIFLPMKHPEGDWDARRLSPAPVEDAQLTASDGVKLHGWYAEPPVPPRAAFLVLHGNAGNVTHRMHLLVAGLELGCAVLVLDYRGYGRSEGTPSEKGVVLDAQAGRAWLLARGFAERRIVAYGESLGAAVAVELARRAPLGGLVLQSAFTSVHDMAGRVLLLPGVGYLVGTRMASIDKVPSIAVPKLHFHGRRDEIIPFEQGRRLYEAAAEPKTWVEFEDVGHNDWPGRYRAEWIAAMDSFLTAVTR